MTTAHQPMPTIKITMNRAAMTENEKKNFLADLAEVLGVSPDDIKDTRFIQKPAEPSV